MWKAAAPTKNIIRDKDWKKKPSTLNKKKRITPGRPKQLKTIRMSSKIESAKKSLFKSPQKDMPLRSPNKSLSDAKRRSLLTYRAKQLIYRMHKRTLETLLASNGFKRINIEGDGNCFFAAVCASNPDLDASKLRQDICLHMQENAQEYIDFIPSNTEISNEEKKDIFQGQVNYLKQEGNWSNELGDTLPLAVSNYLKREIMIISSNRNKPVLRIQPTIGKTLDDSLITLAYLAIPGSEHYDACVPIDKNISNNQPDKANSESRPPKTPDKQTPKKQGKMSSGFNITPRKQADYISPKKKTRTRKRKAVPAEWKKNIRKRLRLSGKEYTNTRGKLVEAKSVKDQDCSKCRYKCSTKISEEERREIFDNYWSLQDYKRQRDYICSSILQASPERIRPKAKNPRKITRQFSFVNNGAQVRVCKTFFLKTLDIGEKTVEYALKSNSHKTFSSQDKRGRHVPHNLTPEPSMEHVRRHIESFPVMDPHYTRKDTRRKFLGSDLNISKMYRLYKEECVQNRRKPVGAGKYRKVFCEEYNFSFHTPKKDQCQLCTLYYQKEKEGNLSDELKKRYEDHIQRKNKARDEKSSDKAYAKSNPAYHCATFDLQSVLHTPCSNVSQVYYKRKLNCYNLSVYSLGNSDATCFMWNETEGKRGSNEIGTCLLMYIRSLPITSSRVCFFSDSCSGQNRNRHVAAAMLHTVNTCDNIISIDLKYLETGHTEMECDSMHAAVEAAKKHTSIYVPSQWDTVVRMARKRKPYAVVPLKFTDILNFKEVAESLIPSTVYDTSGKKVKWMQIKWIQFRKTDPETIFYKYSFIDEDFGEIKLKHSTSRRKATVRISEEIPKSFDSKLPISSAKKKDLVDLCKNGTIPEEYYHYYNNLPCDSSLMDVLPEPDFMDEFSEDTDND